jgi:DNA-binding IclR family transcriptional regulator
MKDKLKKAVAAVKAYFQRAKLVFTQVETMVHAVVVAAIGGGADALYTHYHQTGQILFTATQLAEAKVHFITGAGLAILAWLKSAPAIKQGTPQQ